MKWILMLLGIIVLAQFIGGRIDSMDAPDASIRPARIESSALAGFDMLSNPRKRLIESALALANGHDWLPYLAGSADPGLGGLDCSGAMYVVMRNAGLNPPRSSIEQMKWLGKSGGLHMVSKEARDPAHPSLANLKPGDLLFWAEPDKDGETRVHHVAMYLGKAASDGLPLMINATNGRTYRGTKANGYGVYDFIIPVEDALSKLVGYGTPPGIE